MEERDYIFNNSEAPIHVFIGLDGREVSAEELHFVWKSRNFKPEGYNSWYSDRMYESNPEKFRSSVVAVWPYIPDRQFFDCTEPEDVNKFLNLYLGRDVELTAILMAVNASTGYPYWMFIWEENSDNTDIAGGEVE